MRGKLWLTTVLASLCSLVLGIGTVHASSSLQAQIDQVLRAHGGRQISAHSIAWDGGRVVLTLPDPGQRQAPADAPALSHRSGAASAVPLTGWVHDCPYSSHADGDHYYCFYQDVNWGGRRVQFLSCGGVEDDFSNYGFDKQTSSWVNTKGLGGSAQYTIQVWDGPGGNGTRLWTEPPNTASSSVGTDNNDRASSWTC